RRRWPVVARSDAPPPSPARRRWPPGLIHSRRGGTPNGVFVTGDELGLPVTTITPVASHTAQRFEVGTGFDVNPAVWKVLAGRGIRIRGRDPGDLGLDRSRSCSPGGTSTTSRV